MMIMVALMTEHLLYTISLLNLLNSEISQYDLDSTVLGSVKIEIF